MSEEAQELGKEIEQKAIENIDAVALASGTFGIMYPKFLLHLSHLSKKSMFRVIRALIGVPLEEKLPNWKDPEEKTSYLIGERLLEAKSVIIIDTLFKHQVELEKLKQTSEPTEESKENPNDNPST